MTIDKSKQDRHPPLRRMAQPECMKTKAYVYGVEPLDGDDAWAMFEASASGDEGKVEVLLGKDNRLVNAQYCYQFPIHLAVRAGHTKIVQMLLAQGADPGESRYTYDSWNKLLRTAQDRGEREIETLLVHAMKQRFGYDPDFKQLQDAIISRSFSRVDEVMTSQPGLTNASDALGNNALHWSVITRQLALIDYFIARGAAVDALRADGQSPILLAVNGATDYWHRETRDRSHPSLRNTSVLIGSLLAHGARYTISVAAAIGDMERVEHLIQSDRTLASRLDSARLSPLTYASRSGYVHIVKRLLELGADPNRPEECAPEGRALYEACCGNHLSVAQVLLEHGANPNAGVDSCECCLTIAEVYHGERAKALQDLLRDHGAYLPPYRMNVDQLKQAIRDQHPAVRHDEFLRCVMQHCDAELFDLLIESDPTVVRRLEAGDELVHLTQPDLIRKLLLLGLDPTRPDWLGVTLLENCEQSGNELLPKLFAEFGKRT